MTEPTLENPTTEDGTWSTPDGGKTWLLTEPSQAWLDAQAAIDNGPEPGANPSDADRIADLEAALNALAGGGE